MISDYAFEDINENVKEIILRGPVEYVGSRAFYKLNADKTTTSPIQSIFFTDYEHVGTNELSTARFGLGDEYKEFLSSQKIYVAKSKESNYKNSWTTFADQITYQIPFPAISTKFGTFSREFDVDLQDNNGSGDVNWNTELDKPNIIAFTGFEKNFSYKDKEGNDVTGIIMKSINCDATDGTDGTYIPANTGVLLRAYTDNSQSPSGFYYRMGEKTKDAPESNIMQCVTESSRSVSPTETIGDDVYTNYVISGGKYWSLSSAITIPAHKSYMHIKTGTKTSSSAASQTKSVKMVFYGTDYLQGDVNGDYDIDSTDCKLLSETILGNKTASSNSSDVNGDGKVDILDITTLIDIQNGNATPEWRTGN